MSERGKGGRESLEELRKRLAAREAEAARRAAPPKPRKAPPKPPPQASPEPAEPERPVSFDDEMKRMGVAPPPAGPERILATRGGGPAAGRVPAPPPPEPEEVVDEEELWAGAVRGAVERRRGVERIPPGERASALPTLDLHGMAVEDALHELRRFIALHRGAEPKWVRVIRGRGTHGLGALRRPVVAWLQGTSQVATIRPGAPKEGGDGVLLVQLTRRSRP